MNVNVVENTDNAVHVTLPAAPEGHAELSDEELANVAGGALPTQNKYTLLVIPVFGCNVC
jgi:mersacidin/lichenicidin family type 2 lantibiotic